MAQALEVAWSLMSVRFEAGAMLLTFMKGEARAREEVAFLLRW